MIEVVPLGAGQDVGRSCVLVTMGGKNIMFDCGMHMGYSDERRFPDFSYISASPDVKYETLIDCVIITHLYVLVLHVPLCTLILNILCFAVIWTTVVPCLILPKCVDIRGLYI